MILTEEERGFLLTTMGDETVAVMLEQPLAWVVEARAFLASPSKVVVEVPMSPAGERLVGAVFTGKMPRARKPKLQVIEGGPIVHKGVVFEPAADEPPTAAMYDLAIAMGFGDVVTVEGFTIQETRDLLFGNGSLVDQPFAGLTPLKGEPAKSTPKSGIQAAWREITAVDHPEIGVATTGYAQVEGEPRPARATGKWPDTWAKVDGAATTKLTAEDLARPASDLYPVLAPLLGLTAEEYQQREAAKKAKREKRHTIALTPLPDRVVRWAGWFLKAGWTAKEVAHLFDCKPSQLPEAT